MTLYRIEDDIAFAGMGTPDAWVAFELPGSSAVRIFGEQVNPAGNAFLDMRREVAERSSGGVSEDHLLRHALRPQFRLDLFPGDTLAAMLAEGLEFLLGQSAKCVVLSDRSTIFIAVPLKTDKIRFCDDDEGLPPDLERLATVMTSALYSEESGEDWW